MIICPKTGKACLHGCEGYCRSQFGCFAMGLKEKKDDSD